MTSVEALWTAKFGTAEYSIAESEGGVAIIETGKVYGGDSIYRIAAMSASTEVPWMVTSPCTGITGVRALRASTGRRKPPLPATLLDHDKATM